MKIECPNCKKILSVPDTYKNKRIKCKYCGQVLVAMPLDVKIVVPSGIIQKLEVSEKPSEDNLRPSHSNFFTKIWTKSPAAFRNAFLATLGVLSALLVVYYIYGINKWFQQPAVSYNSSMSAESAKSIPVIDANAYHLAAVIKLWEYRSSLQILQQIRAEAATKYLVDVDKFAFFLSTLLCTQNQLEELYMQTKNLKIPEKQPFIIAHQDLLAAVDAEYSFEKSIFDLVQNPNSLYMLSQMKDRGDQAIELTNCATFSIAGLFIMVDPKVVDSLIQIKE